MNPVRKDHTEEGWSFDKFKSVISVLVNRNPQYLYFYLFIIFSGIRRSEAEGLTRSHVDLESRRIDISQQRARKQLKGQEIFKPKTKTAAGKREFTLNDDALLILRKQRQHVEEMRQTAGSAWIENDLVFCRSDGSPLSNAVYEQFKRICRDVTLHDLRHAYADLCVNSEVPDKALQGILGHASIVTTHNVYTKRNDTLSRLAAEKVNAYLDANFSDFKDLIENAGNNLGTESGDKGILG